MKGSILRSKLEALTNRLRCDVGMADACIACIRKIAFAKGGGSDGERLLIPRAWEGLLPKRILIYCTKHEMNEEGRTIIRDHLKFPDVEVKKTVTEENKKILTSESLVGREKVVSKKMVTIPTERSEQKQKPSAEEVGGRNGDKVFSGFDSLRKVTINTASKKELKTFTSEEKKTPVGEHKWSSSKSNGEGECQKSLGHGNKRGNATLGKLQHGGKERHRRGIVEISSVNKRRGIANQHSELSETGNMQFGRSSGGTQLNIPVDTGSCSQGQDSVYDRIGLRSSTCGHQGLAAESFSGMKPLSMVPYGPGERKPGYLGNPLGFAPGPHQNYSVHNSAGWLDE
ncbi:ENHANCED DOWNY MILDEW 2 [Prunus dulcis]|uniref:ENHANCED DOWNY MILDEW 2 n=1 Tax=Prunus dulcis TaxID=3755 RepID=A0A4Y1RD44_PRUDU|nr:ENHANCED DOWNY MILDEW 2 [Prunus dulcis]